MITHQAIRERQTIILEARLRRSRPEKVSERESFCHEKGTGQRACTTMASLALRMQ